ncbi:MAG: hypothetical protein JO049_13280, partial [Hyphomicrobiales bacterium]|nr:hypothetical protein [Hyphomicrobiales bacterium]
DFANRLPRGRTYVNNGSVIDLQIARGKVEALISGSEIYRVKIDIAIAAPARWKAICADCAGSVGSIVELLQGRLSKHVMERVCREADGLFPAPKEIKMSCSCPDWAGMCKHVAATLYGVGARLDHDPDLLFTLRGVGRSELVSAGADLSITEAAAGSERVLVDNDVAALFGLELEIATPAGAIVENKAPTTERATPEAEQANSASPPARAARDRATKAACESTAHAARKSASKLERAASTAKANSAADGSFAPVTRSGRGKSASGIPDAKAQSARAPKPTRESAPAPSISAKANRNAASDRAAAKHEPMAEARQRPNLKPIAAEKPREGRTRAAKWIGVKARQAART